MMKAIRKFKRLSVIEQENLGIFCAWTPCLAKEVGNETRILR